MAHTDTQKHISLKKRKWNPVCGCERRDARNLCVLLLPCVLVRVTERAADVFTPALCSNQQGETGCGVRMGWEVKPKELTVCAVVAVAVVVVVLCSRCCSVVSLSPSPGCVRSCVCMLPSCWFVSHSPFFCFSVCPFYLFFVLFFYLCVTVRPFLCGSVSCV